MAKIAIFGTFWGKRSDGSGQFLGQKFLKIFGPFLGLLSGPIGQKYPKMGILAKWDFGGELLRFLESFWPKMAPKRAILGTNFTCVWDLC